MCCVLDPKNAFQQDDICAFSDAVTKVLSCFHRYQSLLYSRPRHLRTQRQEDFSSVPTPTASQPNEATYGNHDEPFFYPRHGGFGKRRTSLCVPQCDASLHKGGLPASRTIMYPSDALEQDLDSIAGKRNISELFFDLPVSTAFTTLHGRRLKRTCPALGTTNSATCVFFDPQVFTVGYSMFNYSV